VNLSKRLELEAASFKQSDPERCIRLIFMASDARRMEAMLDEIVDNAHEEARTAESHAQWLRKAKMRSADVVVIGGVNA
jgi:hypothetical protein